MTIEAVVFDFGNVLIRWDPDGFYDQVIGPDRRRKLFAEVPLLQMNERVDLGADMLTEVQALAAQYPDWGDEIRMWHDDWLRMASPTIDRSVQILRALRRRGVPVFALSNFGVATLRLAQAHYPFLEEFDQRFISGEMGVMKPDPQIYAQLEQATGVSPEGLLFTDDRPENIEAAAARGWQVHLFEGARGFAERVVTEGLLNADDII